MQWAWLGRICRPLFYLFIFCIYFSKCRSHVRVQLFFFFEFPKNKADNTLNQAISEWVPLQPSLLRPLLLRVMLYLCSLAPTSLLCNAIPVNVSSPHSLHANAIPECASSPPPPSLLCNVPVNVSSPHSLPPVLYREVSPRPRPPLLHRPLRQKQTLSIPFLASD